MDGWMDRWMDGWINRHTQQMIFEDKLDDEQIQANTDKHRQTNGG